MKTRKTLDAAGPSSAVDVPNDARAAYRVRTDDLKFGKLLLYQLS